MKKITLLLYLIVVMLLAVATFIEYTWGSIFVSEHIYHTATFCCLWGMLALCTLFIVYKRKMWRQFSLGLLHLSFLIILVGAGVSFLSSKKGYIHLRKGDVTTQFVEQESGKLVTLPFSLKLDTFWINYYPGTEAPSDYISRVYCHSTDSNEFQTTISMNQVLDYKGYRFYQSSYDEDLSGSILSVNYDPWGTAITYSGYLLLGLSMVGVLLNRTGEFRRLLKHPLLKSGFVWLCILIWGVSGEVYASTKKLPIISKQEADSLSVLQVIYHDRVVPYNTLARDFVKKISGKENFSGLMSEQVLGSWQQYADEWKYVPIIKIKNAELRHRLGLKSSYARLVDLFDGEYYRLRDWWHPEGKRGNKSTALEKAILETDEKVALVWMLQQGSLIRFLPDDGSVKPLSSLKIKAEIFYNRIPFNKILFMGTLTLGVFSFAWFLFSILRKRKMGEYPWAWKQVNRTLKILLMGALSFHFVGYLLRWYIGGRIPLSNGYETMQFMALCILALAVWLYRRFPFILPFGFLLAGFTLLVAYLGQMNPQITPLVPVLMSPWLSAHVSLIMISYALLAFILLNGVLGLCLSQESERLMLFSRMLLYPAVFFLGIGIFIGAVWANVSWGRYWAWDPKEVWALITFMIYGLAFHSQSLPLFRRPFFFHSYMIVAFLTVLMTYFGVNFFLGGMHSYA